MKTLRKIFIIISVFVVGSCDYLDVVPDNIATIEYAFRNRTAAEKYLYTCYSYRPPLGSLITDPGMNGADETWQFYPKTSAFPTWASSEIARDEQSVTSPILNYWDGENSATCSLWTGIRDCNIFLENIDDVYDMESSEITRWTAEVKFLKAYYHYFLFKCYGPIPIVDENLDISASFNDVQVYRQPVDSVVNYIVNLMDEAYEDLPKASEIIRGTEAGRIDKLIAKSMKAEVLLFTASPLFNGNTDYASMVDNRGIQLFPQEEDNEKWKKAAEACKEAIDACLEGGKELYNEIDAYAATAPEPFQQEVKYREAICDRWNEELIFGNTNNDYNHLSRSAQARILRMSAETLNDIDSQWAPTLKMVGKYYSSNGVPIDEDVEWQNNDWYDNRYKLRDDPSSGDEIYYVKEGKQTVYLHYNREPRFYASLGFDKGIYFGNGYYDFDDDVKYCDFLNLGYSGYQGGSEYSITGYAAKKMHSFKNAVTSSSTSVEYYPFPIMRLANLYLMYAEALNEYSGPSEEVYYYLDLIRERAGLNGVKDSWSNYSTNPTKPDTKSGLREIIQQERTIELAFEGKRFWDIRRWKQIDELNVQPKGWYVQGETPETFYNVTSVAKTAVEFSIKDYFWPIKEENLTVNTNLIQNYGW